MTVIAADIYDEDDPNGSPLGTITDEDAVDLEFEIHMRRKGTGRIVVPTDSPLADLVRPDRYVKWRVPVIDTDPIWGTWLRTGSIGLSSKGERGALRLIMEGPGPRDVLRLGRLLEGTFAPVPPASEERGSSTTQGLWRWVNQHRGAIAARAMEEGINQTAGMHIAPLSGVTFDWDRTDDSGSVAWADPIDVLEQRIGVDIDTFLALLEQGGGFIIEPEPNLLFHAWQTFPSRDLTSTVIFQAAGSNPNVASEMARSLDSMDRMNAVLLDGMANPDGGYELHYDNGTDTSRAHIGYFEMPTNISDYVDLVADRVIEASNAGINKVAVEVDPTQYLPGKSGTNGDFWVGDKVGLKTQDGSGDWDYNGEAQLVTGIRIGMRSATDDSTTSRARRSLKITALLNDDEVRGFGGIANPQTTVQIPPIVVPTPPSGGTTIARWDSWLYHDNRLWDETDTYPVRGRPKGGGYGGTNALNSYLGYDTGDATPVPVSPSTDVVVSAEFINQWNQTLNYAVKWYNSGGTLLDTNIFATVPNDSLPHAYEVTFTSPSTAASMSWGGVEGAALKIFAAYVELKTGGTPGSPGNVGSGPAVPSGNGSWGTSPVAMPADTVIPAPPAENIGIDDDGEYFDDTIVNVEDALQDLAARLTASRVSIAEHGGWGFIQDPRAVVYGQVTYIGYVRGDTGDICVRTYDHDTRDVGDEITIAVAFAADDHVHPTLLVRESDKKLLVFYSDHNASALYMVVSDTSLDSDPLLTDGFGSATNLDSSLGGTAYTDPTPIQLTGETNDPIYLFWREETPKEWWCNVSTNGGSTWGSKTKIITESGGWPYVKFRQNGDDRIDVAWNDQNPASATADLYHAYYQSSAWHGTDGTTKTLPLDSSNGTLVYNADNNWVQDLAFDDGSPVIVTSRIADATDQRVLYATWSGSAWSVEQVATAGPGIDDATDTVPPGIALDQVNPGVVYASRMVGSFREVFRYTKRGGAWQGQPLTTDSTKDQLRPMSPHGAHADLRVLWMSGTFTAAEDFDTAVRGSGFGDDTGAGSTGSVGALGDLSDVAITSPEADQHIQYVGGEWVNNHRRWEPVVTDPGGGPELVFDDGDIVMTWADYT